MRKLSHFRMKLLKLICFVVGNRTRTEILKRADVFADFGKNIYYCSKNIPEEPYMVKLHDNVVIAANVNLVTHDILNDMLARMIGAAPGEVLSEYEMGTIEILDNVAIGRDTTILYNTKIGPNAVIAAGSVVTKNVPEGAVVGGNPARVIGSIDSLLNKRKCDSKHPINRSELEQIVEYYWN